MTLEATLLRRETAGPQLTGVGLWIIPTDASYDLEIQRAPNVAGAPGAWATTSTSQIYTASGTLYIDPLPLAPLTKYWYRARQVRRDRSPGNWTTPLQTSATLLTGRALREVQEKAVVLRRPAGGHLVDSDMLGGNIGAHSANLLQNGGGQDGPLGVQADGWTFGAANPLVCTIADSSIGDRCLELTNAVAADSSSYQETPVAAGDVVTLSGMMRAENIAGAGQGAQVRLNGLAGCTYTVLDASAAFVSAVVPTTAVTDFQFGLGKTNPVGWQPITCMVRINAAGTLRTVVVLGFGGTCTGTMRLDGLVLRKVDKTAEQAYEASKTGNAALNLLRNGGGEEGVPGALAPSWSANIVVATDKSRYGSRSLKMTAAGALLYGQQSAPVAPGDVVEVSGWVNIGGGLGGAGEGAGLQLTVRNNVNTAIAARLLDSAGPAYTDAGGASSKFAYVPRTDASGAWQYVSMTVVIPAGGVTVEIGLSMGYATGVTGPAWFDGVRLAKRSPSIVQGGKRGFDGFDDNPRLKDHTKAQQGIVTGPGGVARTSMLTVSDVGSFARITIAAFTVDLGDRTLSYTGGIYDGAFYSTDYYVYCDDPNYLGGTPALGYQATTVQSDLAKSLGRVYLGFCHTPAAGGVGGTGGGGGVPKR